MNFAKNILSKYGWKEGDGLGKKKQGIKRPIKANLKFDQAGLGADPSAEFSNNWWERAFNDAAKNVQVKNQENGDVKVNLKDKQNSVEVTTKGYSIKKLRESGSMYGKNFMSEDVAFSSFAVTECKALTDEELFVACGGRTAHKGARHGLKLSGKLARLEQQEKELLAKMQAKVSETGLKASKNSSNSTQAFREVLRNETASSQVLNDLQKRSKRKCKDSTDEFSSEKILDSVHENLANEHTTSTNETDQMPSKCKKKQKIIEDSQGIFASKDELRIFKSDKSKKKEKKRPSR